MVRGILLLLALASGEAAGTRQALPAADDVESLVLGLEAAAAAGDRAAILGFGAPGAAARGLEGFAGLAVPAAQRFVIKERDRTKSEQAVERLLVEAFVERGNEAEISTWMLDLDRSGADLKIAAAERLSVVSGLYRLSLNETTKFELRNLTVRATDLSLEMAS